MDAAHLLLKELKENAIVKEAANMKNRHITVLIGRRREKMPVNDEWQAIPPFEASLGKIIKLFECPHCHMWVKRMPVICPNCNKYCGRPGSSVGKSRFRTLPDESV